MNVDDLRAKVQEAKQADIQQTTEFQRRRKCSTAWKTIGSCLIHHDDDEWDFRIAHQFIHFATVVGETGFSSRIDRMLEIVDTQPQRQIWDLIKLATGGDLYKVRDVIALYEKLDQHNRITPEHAWTAPLRGTHVPEEFFNDDRKDGLAIDLEDAGDSVTPMKRPSKVLMSADLINWLRESKIGGTKISDETVRRYKNNWRAVAVAGTNNQRFRFDLAALEADQIPFPQSWEQSGL